MIWLELIARFYASLTSANRASVASVMSTALIWLTTIIIGQSVFSQIDQSKPERNFTWTPQWQVNRYSPGYPLLEGVGHFSIQPPSVGSGAYHHHPQITVFNDTFYAIWSAHRSGEDGPGQWVLFAHSANGQDWSKPTALFPSIDVVRQSSARGRALTALCFVVVADRLFAVAEAHQNVGFTSNDRLITSPAESSTRSEKHPKRSRKGLGRLVRSINSPTSWGAIYWLNENKPSPVKGHVDYPVATKKELPEIQLIKNHLGSTLGAPTWDFSRGTTEIRSGDGTLLTEPTTFPLLSGDYGRLWRAQNTTARMYGQISADGRKWSAPKITPIPDAPSKTVTLTLGSGEVLLIGNQVYNKRGTRRDPLTVAISSNGLEFDRAFSLRWRSPKFRVASQQTEPDGRGTGFQYPSAIINDGLLWVIYSVNKEAIDISGVQIDALLKLTPCGYFDVDCINQVIDQSQDRFKDVVFDKDAVLKGFVVDRVVGGAYRLQMVWDLKQGRRLYRFVHICDADGRILRHADSNRGLFESVIDQRRVLDSIRLSADDVRDGAWVTVGFFDPKRKVSPIINSAGEKTYNFKLFEL